VKKKKPVFAVFEAACAVTGHIVRKKPKANRCLTVKKAGSLHPHAQMSVAGVFYCA